MGNPEKAAKCQQAKLTDYLTRNLHREDHSLNEKVHIPEPIIPTFRVAGEVVRMLQTEKFPELILPSYSSIQEAAKIYYQQYLKLFKENRDLNDSLIDVLKERNNLADVYSQLKRAQSIDDNIRRRRRYAKEIQRNYYCPVPKCNKGYGSEGSLTHHVRLKHVEFFESGQYQAYISRLTDMIEKHQHQEHQQLISKDREQRNKQRSDREERKNNEDSEIIKLQD